MATNILSRQQRRLREAGLSDEQAKWLAHKQQRNNGNTQGNSFKLSEQGKFYSTLGSLEREIRRRSQRSGKPTSAYTVVGNKIVLKK